MDPVSRKRPWNRLRRSSNLPDPNLGLVISFVRRGQRPNISLFTLHLIVLNNNQSPATSSGGSKITALELFVGVPAPFASDTRCQKLLLAYLQESKPREHDPYTA